MANYASTRAIVAGWQGDFSGAVAKFREAIDYDVPGRYEFRTRFAQYLLEVSGSPDVEKIKDFEQIVLRNVEDVKMDVKENPGDYLPLLYLSRLYIMLGRNNPSGPYNDLSLQYSAKALEISPTFVRTYYEVGQAYLNKRDYQHAFEAFKKAADLNPDVALSWWYSGIVDVQLGNTKEGLQYITRALDLGYTLSETDALRLVDAYLRNGDLKSVAQIYQQLTTSSPKNVVYWSQLAATYIELGQITDAIQVTRQAMAANPDDATFREQATEFLRQLGTTP